MLLHDLQNIEDGRIISRQKELTLDGDPNYYDMIVAVSQLSNNVKGNKQYAQRVIESKMKSSGVLFDQTKFDQTYSDFRKAPASRAAFYKHPEDSKSVKDQIAELECQKAEAKKMGYGTDAYDAAIAELQKYSTDGGPGSGQKGHTTKTSSKDEDDIFTQDPLTEKGKEILEAMKKQYGEKKGEDIFYASKNKGIITGVDAKDSDIIINISENPDKFEEKAFDSMHYNGYNIKQIKETGEFDIYDLGGAIIGHTATFELAKIFIDNKGRSIIGRTE